VLWKLTGRTPEDVSTLLKDADGKWHLNYFAGMLSGASEVSSWKRAHFDRINQEIEKLRAEPGPLAERRAAKWEWFRDQFEVRLMR
jgi:hypothetical protein